MTPHDSPAPRAAGTAASRPSDQSSDRRVRMLRTALGPHIAQALDDEEIVEILVNPDGQLWFDRLGSGRAPSGISMSADDAERVIRLIAAHVRAEVHAGAPILSAELPLTGERFEGLLPPVVEAPSFSIRKRTASVIPLHQYVVQGVLSQPQADVLREAIHNRLNILIAGPTSSGKTTLANALLQEVACTGDRVIVMEDTVELQCLAADRLTMRTLAGSVSMRDLVRSTLRLRPDRIVIGEVRGGEALDLLKAWGTGHPGGIATIHAGSPLGALARLEQLILEVSMTVPRALIAEAVDLIVCISGRGRARRVDDIVRVTGCTAQGYQLERITLPPHSTGVSS